MNAMQHHKFSLTRQAGVTLVEVLISMSIFSIGLLSLLHYSAGSVKQLSENNPRSLALEAAEDSMVAVYIAANNNDLETIKTKIEQMSSMTIVKGPYRFTVTPASLKNADNSNTELLGVDGTLSDTASWVSPLSLGIRVQFGDRTDSQENVTLNVPFTIVF